MVTDRIVALLEELILFRAAVRQNLVSIPFDHRIHMRVKLYELFLELGGTDLTYSQPSSQPISQPSPSEQEKVIYN